jgi:hypothetical protein
LRAADFQLSAHTEFLIRKIRKSFHAINGLRDQKVADDKAGENDTVCGEAQEISAVMPGLVPGIHDLFWL